MTTEKLIESVSGYRNVSRNRAIVAIAVAADGLMSYLRSAECAEDNDYVDNCEDFAAALLFNGYYHSTEYDIIQDATTCLCDIGFGFKTLPEITPA